MRRIGDWGGWCRVNADSARRPRVTKFVFESIRSERPIDGMQGTRGKKVMISERTDDLPRSMRMGSG